MKKTVFERESFEDMKMVSEKYDSKRAILTKLSIRHEWDDFTEEEGCIGIIAEAEIHIPFKIYNVNGEVTNWKIDTVSSGGIWGVSAEDEISIEDEEHIQVDELLGYLEILNIATDLLEQKE